MKKVLNSILLVLVFVSFVSSQQPSPTPPETDEKDVVKISTSLVQVDTSVTDKKGIPVTDLTTADFEIFQDGKPQIITNLSYINYKQAAPGTAETTKTNPKDKSTVMVPPVKLSPGQVRHTFALVVNDLGLSFGSVYEVKTALKKFIDEQMQPGDLVAIIKTSSEIKVLQQFTSDKQILYNAIQKLRWYSPLQSSGGAGVFDSADPSDPPTTEASLRAQNLNNDILAASTLRAINFVVNGMSRMPGRKAVVLFSDGLKLHDTVSDTNPNGKTLEERSGAPTPQINGGVNGLVEGSYNSLIESANRASIVIYGVDPRGLVAAMPEAADGIIPTGGGGSRSIGAGQSVAQVTDTRTKDLFNSQSDLKGLSEQTGGFAVINNNNLNKALDRVLTDQKGYYLIGYQPDEDTFKGKKFHKIEIRLKRSDLIIRTRPGFYGLTDEAIRPKPRTGDSELYAAAAAPIPNADMNISLSASFANVPDKGNFIHALLYIDGKDIKLVDEGNGNKKAIFDIVAVTLDENSKVISDFNHTNTVHFPESRAAEVEQRGLIYTVDVPVKKEGVYTFRTALRDSTTKRIGSASQIIEVPNLKKDKLLVSGLSLSGVDANGKIFPPELPNADNSFVTVVTKAVPAIRQFRRNSIISYSYTIYNAKIDAASNQPNLSIQINLYNDGKLYSGGKPQADQIEKQTDMTRIRDYGYLRLNPEVPFGNYSLQIIVKDLQTNQTSLQWIDFEVIE